MDFSSILKAIQGMLGGGNKQGPVDGIGNPASQPTMTNEAGETITPRGVGYGDRAGSMPQVETPTSAFPAKPSWTDRLAGFAAGFKDPTAPQRSIEAQRDRQARMDERAGMQRHDEAMQSRDIGARERMQSSAFGHEDLTRGRERVHDFALADRRSDLGRGDAKFQYELGEPQRQFSNRQEQKRTDIASSSSIANEDYINAKTNEILSETQDDNARVTPEDLNIITATIKDPAVIDAIKQSGVGITYGQLKRAARAASYLRPAGAGIQIGGSPLFGTPTSAPQSYARP